MLRRGSLGPLGIRLALAFLVVAMGALVVLSGLVLVAAGRDVSHLVRQHQDNTAAEVARAAARAYAEAGGWASAEFALVVALAEEGGATVVVLDASGRQLAASPGPGRRAGSGVVRSRAIVVGDQRVGLARLHFIQRGLPSPERRLRDALAREVVAGAGLAALLALAVAIAVSRRITGPVMALTSTARAMERGDSTARVGTHDAPGELGELAAAFDRMADALARENSLRRAVVADVAHELRTPLAILQASLEAIADGVAATTPAQLSSLKDEVLRLGRLIDDLEALAAAEAAGLHSERRPVDLADVAAAAAARLAPHFEAGDLRLETQLSPTVVHGDQQRLHQVVTNLLTNALKFTPPGGEVRLEVGAADGAARMTVTDTGVGIPPEELPHVFERFWRGSQARATAGSGIGLTVVTELVRAHQGSVAVDSTPGRGTRLTVTLPLI
jgi:two-component system sensor histidine kinase BaeS